MNSEKHKAYIGKGNERVLENAKRLAPLAKKLIIRIPTVPGFNDTPEEIAEVIAPQFPETDFESLKTIIARYHEQDTWKLDTVFTEDAFMLLQDILNEASELAAPVDYSTLVNTDFSETAKSVQ